jgi:competence protein ComFC
MTIPLQGNWKIGLAYDVHTLSSTYIGPDESGRDRWENVRSEMGELVYRLKYQRDKDALTKIVALLDQVKGIEKFDYLVPIPPTDATRPFQPVKEIALALGQHCGVPVLTDCLRKKPGSEQLKNVTDPERRSQILHDTLYLSDEKAIDGKNVLLIDDLFRSGTTLFVATELLYGAMAGKVCVLTMTKTRSNR